MEKQKIKYKKLILYFNVIILLLLFKLIFIIWLWKAKNSKQRKVGFFMGENKIEIGKAVEDFALYGDDGKEYKLSDYAGNKNILIFFYSKDNTSGCTLEVTEFGEISEEVAKHDFVIFGVSKDSVKTHSNFKKKLNLNYTLLSDTEKLVLNQFNVVVNKKMYGKDVVGTERSTFIINKKGELVKEFRKVKPSNHAGDVLEYIKRNF